jgi:small nuclear ribonucleoprotein D3
LTYLFSNNMASATSSSSSSACVKLLHEAEGHPITVELRSGELYRGHLSSVEDSMNCQLTSVVHTGRDGKVTKLEHVYIRGSQLRFAVLPELLKNAPIFKNVQSFAEKKAKPLPITGRGKGGKGSGGGKSKGGGGGSGGAGGGTASSSAAAQ